MLLNTPTAHTAPILFVGGKGGVGKTTVAAARALALADAGHRVLLMSTDPAHSLGDVLEHPLGDRPVRVAPGLWAAEPDADTAVRRRIAQVVRDAERALPAEIMPAVRRHLDHAGAAPGMAESALADLLMERMEEVGDRWDRLVVDSAPTGHLLRLLALPTLLTPWVTGLTRRRERARKAEAFADAVVAEPEEDPLLARLHERRHRLEGAAARLRSASRVGLVTVPRRMVLAETARALDSLTEAGFPLDTVIVNQIPPPGAVGPDGTAVLAEIRRRFAHVGVTEVPLADREPTGPSGLRALAAHLPG
ncbi:ArsA family ATPase [Nocardiopsis sp. DSM 44743]|uniref:ArsA family ATPase n=1 Tax=Nocardiopsis lambiniae TaxID=3075539 RepID=A0ABU2MD53_9ACTN|nr:ArsA family ATPase [Nocardiopsis sp. DSM 44743]MDT0330050.1 ArsA family ATPase [Nocardiopsis sp. DSM 44743]